MLSNAYFLAKFGFDTAENEPAKNLQNFAKKIANFLNFPLLSDRPSASVVGVSGASERPALPCKPANSSRSTRSRVLEKSDLGSSGGGITFCQEFLSGIRFLTRMRFLYGNTLLNRKSIH